MESWVVSWPPENYTVVVDETQDGTWLTALFVSGSSSQWAFGGPMGAAPGLSNAQSRTNGGALSSFAQTIGGSQSHTPLNLE